MTDTTRKNVEWDGSEVTEIGEVGSGHGEDVRCTRCVAHHFAVFVLMKDGVALLVVLDSTFLIAFIHGRARDGQVSVVFAGKVGLMSGTDGADFAVVVGMVAPLDAGGKGGIHIS